LPATVTLRAEPGRVFVAFDSGQEVAVTLEREPPPPRRRANLFSGAQAAINGCNTSTRLTRSVCAARASGIAARAIAPTGSLSYAELAR